MEIGLHQLKEGQKALVHAIIESDVSLTLTEMGLFPGEEICLHGAAPFGDPLLVKVGNTTLFLRKEDAKSVMVQLLENSL